ncbi:MAG TPA: hypothetical protein VL335_02465 [Candidatus Paceibacterota bacterium]|jgi:Tfp pilus assembly protein PilO|nr:hypothetical protein [Candidatus Paceibacterota bacterium]
MNRNITATILIIIAGAIYFSYTSNLWAEAKVIKAVNDQYSSAIKNAETLISLRKKVTDDYNSISIQDREKLDKMLPDTVDNIRLVIDLNNVGQQNGLSLKNITASTKTSAPTTPTASSASATGPNGAQGFGQKDTGGISIATLDTVSISFSVSATYQQFIGLMQALEANLRIMDLTHLTVTANDTGTYDFSVQLNTYYLRQ